MKHIVLIGYSDYFTSYEYFNKKIVHVLSSLEEVEIYSVNDNNKLIDRLYHKDVTKKIKLNASKTEIRKLLSDVTHSIYFWDGTGLDKFIYQSILNKTKLKIFPVETTRVVNKDKGEPFEAYIGRGTPWGNPYSIGDEGMSRDEVIDKYKKYFKSHFLANPEKLRELNSLKGRILGCHCKPQACHGDVIAEYLNSDK